MWMVYESARYLEYVNSLLYNDHNYYYWFGSGPFQDHKEEQREWLYKPLKEKHISYF